MTHIKNPDLHSMETKKIILGFLNSKIPEYDEFQTITSEQDLFNIKNDDYLCMPGFNGSRIWAVMCLHEDKYYCVTFLKNPKYKRKNLIIHPIPLQMAARFYQGTIMEGIFYKRDHDSTIIIDDIHFLAGEDVTMKRREVKLNDAIHFFKQFVNNVAHYNMCVGNFYHVDKSSLSLFYNALKENPDIHYVYFLPQNDGVKYIYYVKKDDLIDQTITYQDFTMIKTACPDVYKLINGAEYHHALITDLDHSKAVAKWFRKKGNLRVTCKMINNSGDWIPEKVCE